MKNNILLTAFLALSTLLNAQNRNWSIGGHTGVQFSEAFAFGNGNDYSNINDLTKYRPALFIGAQLLKEFNNTGYFRLGLTLESRLSQVNQFEATLNLGWPSVGTVRVNRRKNYLSLEPEVYAMILEKEKWSMSIGIGTFLSNNFASNTIPRLDGELMEMGSEQKSSGILSMEHLEFGLSLSSGIIHKINDKMNIHVFVFAKHPIKQWEENVNFYFVHRSIGLRLGVEFAL